MVERAFAQAHSADAALATRPRRRLPTALRQRLVVIGLALDVIFGLFALIPGFFATVNPYGMNVTNAMADPSFSHWFGTDGFGRDVWSRIVYGSRASLGVGLASVSAALLIGTTLGVLAGYFGGMIDQVLGRLMDILFGFPSLLLAIVVAGVLGPNLRNTILAISVVYVPFFFRIARSPVLVERQREYIEAARTIGASTSRILLRHVLPNILAPVVVQTAITLSYAILIEASLSYLGLGIQPPNPSWGSILNEGRPYLQIAPWISVFPGLVIMLAVMGFNLLGDGLRDVWDPRMSTHVR